MSPTVQAAIISNYTTSSAITDKLYNALCQLKSCQLLHNCNSKLYNSYYYYYTHLMASFPGNLGKPVLER